MIARNIPAAIAVPLLLMGCTTEVGTETAFEHEAALASQARSIQNVASQQCLHAGSLSSGAQVRQATCDGSNNQQFLVEPTVGLFVIRNTTANLCVNLGSYLAPGWSLQLGSCTDSFAHWLKHNRTAITGGERTSFLFPYLATFECIDLPASPSGQLRTNACSTANSQKFEVRVNAAPPPPPPPQDPPDCAPGQYCCEPEGTGCAVCIPNKARCQ
jgi:hypothetical protein